jgi:outer membrane murein-binding lipoprotein Lpp
MNYGQANHILQQAKQSDTDYGRNDRLGASIGAESISKQVSPLHEAIKQLEQDIAALGEVYGKLHRRLEPITAQVPVNETTKVRQDSYGVSNVVQALGAQSDRLREIRSAMQRQVECLEV